MAIWWLLQLVVLSWCRHVVIVLLFVMVIAVTCCYVCPQVSRIVFFPEYLWSSSKTRCTALKWRSVSKLLPEPLFWAEFPKTASNKSLTLRKRSPPNKQRSKKPTKFPVVSQAAKHQETNNSCQQTQQHSLSGCGTGDWGVDASHVLCFHRYRGCLWMPSTIEYLPSTRCVPPCTKG